MVGTLLDVFDRPVTVRVRDVSLLVPALTLGALATLQGFIRDHSWDPYRPPTEADDDPRTFWALVHEEAARWPLPLGDALIPRAVGDAAYLEEFCDLAFGRFHGLDRDTAARIGLAALEDVVPWVALNAAAYAIAPNDVASRRLNELDGAGADPEGEPIDWPLAVAELVVGGEGRRGMSFAEAESLTLPQFRLLRRAYRDRDGRMRLAAGPACPPRPKEGESARDAVVRRKATLARAKAILEARYAANGSVTGGRSPDPD